MAKAPLRVRLAKIVLGSRAKDYVPALDIAGDGVIWPGSAQGPGIKSYRSKADQLSANLNWSYAANKAIVDDCDAVELQLFRKKPDGDREQIEEHEILDLMANPNNVHTRSS